MKYPHDMVEFIVTFLAYASMSAMFAVAVSYLLISAGQ